MAGAGAGAAARRMARRGLACWMRRSAGHSAARGRGLAAASAQRGWCWRVPEVHAAAGAATIAATGAAGETRAAGCACLGPSAAWAPGPHERGQPGPCAQGAARLGTPSTAQCVGRERSCQRRRRLHACLLVARPPPSLQARVVVLSCHPPCQPLNVEPLPATGPLLPPTNNPPLPALPLVPPARRLGAAQHRPGARCRPGQGPGLLQDLLRPVAPGAQGRRARCGVRQTADSP